MNAYAKAGACLLAGALLCTQAFAERKYSDWGPAVNLGCGTINSASNDQGPGISKDGLSLYFGSDRAGGAGGLDLWVAQRPTQDPAFCSRHQRALEWALLAEVTTLTQVPAPYDLGPEMKIFSCPKS